MIDRDQHDSIVASLRALEHAAQRQADTLAQQADQFTEHLRRTVANEARVAQVETFVTETRAYMQSIKYLGVVAAGGFGVIGTVCAIIALVHSW
jgi:hypothetical protein